MSLFFKQSHISETLLYNKITRSLYIFEETKTMYLDPKHLRSWLIGLIQQDKHNPNRKSNM